MNTVHNTAVKWLYLGQYVWQCGCGAWGEYTTEKVAEEAARRHRKLYSNQEGDMNTVQVYYAEPEVQYEVWSESLDKKRGGFHGSFDTFELADSEARDVRDRLKRVVRVVKVTVGG